MNVIKKLLKGVGTGGLVLGGGVLSILFSILQFLFVAAAGLSMIWAAIELFLEGSWGWGLLLLLVGTPVAISLASYFFAFFFALIILALIIWGIFNLFGFNASFDSVWSIVYLGFWVLILGGIVFAVVSSLFGGKRNWFQRHLNWTLVLTYLLWFVLNAGESAIASIMTWVAALFWLLVLGWVIKQKERAYWWILLSWVGSPLWLKNKSRALTSSSF